jgi:hypothetical protein
MLGACFAFLGEAGFTIFAFATGAIFGVGFTI